jgi:predicted nucleic acid-binding protein
LGLILVDSSAWIDFFRGQDAPHVQQLEQAIRNRRDLAICGIILTETLQGIRNDTRYRQVKAHFSSLILLPMEQPVFIGAADIYRTLRKQGQTIRKTNDCIIAATAIHYPSQLLHNDRDFVVLSRHTPLELL